MYVSVWNHHCTMIHATHNVSNGSDKVTILFHPTEAQDEGQPILRVDCGWTIQRWVAYRLARPLPVTVLVVRWRHRLLTLLVVISIRCLLRGTFGFLLPLGFVGDCLLRTNAIDLCELLLPSPRWYYDLLFNP